MVSCEGVLFSVFNTLTQSEYLHPTIVTIVPHKCYACAPQVLRLCPASIGVCHPQASVFAAHKHRGFLVSLKGRPNETLMNPGT